MHIVFQLGYYHVVDRRDSTVVAITRSLKKAKQIAREAALEAQSA